MATCSLPFVFHWLSCFERVTPWWFDTLWVTPIRLRLHPLSWYLQNCALNYIHHWEMMKSVGSYMATCHWYLWQRWWWSNMFCEWLSQGYGWTHCHVTYKIVVCNFINMPLIVELGWDFFYGFFAGNDMVFVALAVIAIIGYISTLEPFLPQSTFETYH